MRFTKKIVVKGKTFLFNGDVRLHPTGHTEGGYWCDIKDGLCFPCVLTDEQIRIVLENPQMFYEPGNCCVVVSDEEVVDLTLAARHDLKFLVNDPGEPSVGLFGGLSEVRIQITPAICSDPNDPEVVEFWRQACVDFFDVHQVYSVSEFTSEQEQLKQI